jgi:hypothetical protein
VKLKISIYNNYDIEIEEAMYVFCPLQSEDTVKRAAQYKKSSYNKSNSLKSTYESKCRDADRADENNNRLHSNPQAKAKDLTQSAKKMEVCVCVHACIACMCVCVCLHCW